MSHSPFVMKCSKSELLTSESMPTAEALAVLTIRWTMYPNFRRASGGMMASTSLSVFRASSLAPEAFCIQRRWPSAFRVFASPLGSLPRMSSAIALLKARKRLGPVANLVASMIVVVFPEPATAWIKSGSSQSRTAEKIASWKGDQETAPPPAWEAGWSGTVRERKLGIAVLLGGKPCDCLLNPLLGVRLAMQGSLALAFAP